MPRARHPGGRGKGRQGGGKAGKGAGWDQRAYAEAVLSQVEEPWQMDRTSFPVEPEGDARQVRRRRGRAQARTLQQSVAARWSGGAAAGVALCV